MGTSVSAWSTRSMCPGLAQLAGLSFSTGPLRPRNSPGAWRHSALQSSLCFRNPTVPALCLQRYFVYITQVNTQKEPAAAPSGQAS
ncbi:hypothetical protein ASPVEDRAFT_429163 [Aspergillus versicolor CBS 583.65]|uniref:Uncharacterized protein n=1 Tax=Aspergillus versicolor CBS 583.65 TaxID=1036611 RepID=A0A1L9P8G3_ASPVE|nr:uncharacterized protein ASPVEDRAFT_429163 [Aspergillus versicolor CBS 583.65]OJI97788.1 hypothetical protein ASPVEDRAFT_429163 [Aspergillus versicolor CBS 583.65]